MSGLDQMLRLQKWTLDEKRRQATDLEALIERLRSDIRRLEEEVANEVEAARNDLELQRVLPDYKRMMAERRQRIEKSVADLTQELDKLRDQIMESFAELKKTEQTIANRQQRQRIAQRRREQSRADEVGLQLHRRKKDTTL
jgi:flagellar export protein FliJ